MSPGRGLRHPHPGRLAGAGGTGRRVSGEKGWLARFCKSTPSSPGPAGRAATCQRMRT